MASFMTDSTREIAGDHILGGNTRRNKRILPLCEYTISTDLERLSTLSKLIDYDVTHKISAVRLAASGCVYNAEEGYFECTGCAKITMLDNVPQINTVYDIIIYHHQSCPLLSEYIEKQEKEIREGIINLNELKRFHKLSHKSEMPSYDALVQMYGIDQR